MLLLLRYVIHVHVYDKKTCIYMFVADFTKASQGWNFVENLRGQVGS